jgi:hypothetical protein
MAPRRDAGTTSQSTDSQTLPETPAETLAAAATMAAQQAEIDRLNALLQA